MKYKVLLPGKVSPYQHYKFESGRGYECYNFDDNPQNDCSHGYYAVDLDGLCYAYRPGRHIYECEVSGRSVEIDPFKKRYERFTLGKRVSKSEVVNRMRAGDWKWDIEHATFPVDPWSKNRSAVTSAEIGLYNQWVSVWASVRDSVWVSVGASVGASVWDSVGASVRDSVRAYISSLFPDIKWKYIDHEPGVNPFQPAIDLWHAGLVPSYDGKSLRLHNRDKVLWSGRVAE